MTDKITIGEIMEQAQVFASAWSLLGSRFDDGSKLGLSQDEKDNLEVMVGMLVNEVIAAERDQAKQTAKAALRFVDKALNDISDSEDDAIDSLERARLELVEITEA